MTFWSPSKTVRFVACCVLFAGWPAAALAECGYPAPTCSLLDTRDVIFLGTLISQTEIGTYRFRVDEKFKGVKGTSVEIVSTPSVEGSTGFSGLNKQYLVFARRLELDGAVQSYVGGCGRNLVALTQGGALLEQLRREKNGQHVASIYGTLTRTIPYGLGVRDEKYIRPLPGVTLRFQSKNKTLQTTTTADGTYAIDRVSPGTYQIAADLPITLTVWQQSFDEPFAPVEIERKACYEVNVTALPTTRIRGRVLGPDSEPLVDATVSLLLADGSGRGALARQGEGRSFLFSHVPPGDYILAFGGVRSEIIHLTDGQQIENADIRLPAGR